MNDEKARRIIANRKEYDEIWRTLGGHEPYEDESMKSRIRYGYLTAHGETFNAFRSHVSGEFIKRIEQISMNASEEILTLFRQRMKELDDELESL